MSAIPGGVRVQGFIAPTSTTDTYPVTDPHYGLGGLRTVLNLGQRDQIPAARRMVGMLVFVQQQNKYYKLLADLVQWEEVDLSNILTNESDPTVPLHVKRIPAGNANGQILRWNGADWVLAAIPSETDPTVPTHVKQIPQGSETGQVLRWNGTQWTAADGSQLPAGTQAGQVLQWNGTTWEAAAAPSGGITSETDPTVPTHVKQIPQGSTNGHVLRWSGSAWQSAAETDPTVPTHVKQIPQGSETGQVLRWNGTQWTAADGSQLPAGTEPGQVLRWNGTTWEAVTLPPPPPPSGGITAETDPTVPAHVKAIPAGTTNGHVLRWSGSAWQSAAETDPTVPAHVKNMPTPVGASGRVMFSNGSQWYSDFLWSYINGVAGQIDRQGYTTGGISLGLTRTGVTSGVYNNPTSITVDEYGRITNITTVPVSGSGGGGTPTVPPTPNAIFEVYFNTTGIIAVDINNGFFLPIGYGITVEFRASVAADFIDQVDDPFVVEISQPSSGQFVSLNNIPSVPFLFGGYFDVRRTNEMDFEISAGLFSNATGEFIVAPTVYSVGGYDDFRFLEVQVWTFNDAILFFSGYQIDNVTLYQF